MVVIASGKFQTFSFKGEVKYNQWNVISRKFLTTLFIQSMIKAQGGYSLIWPYRERSAGKDMVCHLSALNFTAVKGKKLRHFRSFRASKFKSLRARSSYENYAEHVPANQISRRQNLCLTVTSFPTHTQCKSLIFRNGVKFCG